LNYQLLYWLYLQQCSADLAAATLFIACTTVGATNPAARERETAALMQQLAQLSAELAERDTALLHAGEALEDLEQRLAAAERRATDGGSTTAGTGTQQQQQRSGGDHRADAARAAQHSAVLQEEAARYSELEARKNAVEAELEEAEAWKVCIQCTVDV
jgi:chromosome segregation ATPase